ncbi:phosphatase PAP2 family protein [uncultured Helicobacter sp.]|uniref:phosphatase PAP2 family protein n=1 Tax=uncultured Helicobacter sp. TaxID=175537 RepID=UPI002609CB7B|nr:phosphatase PAP2 family protein [uncultured Helicobacter sp.]
MSLLATLTGISRVVANKHTPVQVIAGAMLGFGVSYLVASRYIDPSIDRISFKHSKDIRQRETYSLSYAHSF